MIIHSFNQTCLVVKMLHYYSCKMKNIPKNRQKQCFFFVQTLQSNLRMFLCESRTPIDSKKKKRGCDVNVKSLYQICFIRTDKWKEKRGHGVEGLELSAFTQLSLSLITVTTVSNSRTIIITTTAIITTNTNTTSSTLWCPDVYSFKMFDLHGKLRE